MQFSITDRRPVIQRQSLKPGMLFHIYPMRAGLLKTILNPKILPLKPLSRENS